MRNAASPYEVIDVRWEATTTSTVTLDFSAAPSASSVRVGVYAAVAGSTVNTTLAGQTDVTLTSSANGDFLRYNGSVWINDAVNLSTDTIGDYVSSLVAGTGITLSNNSGEGATPTITVTSNTFDAYGAATTAAGTAYANSQTYTNAAVRSFEINGDSGGARTITTGNSTTAGDTLTILGGTGLTSVTSATDTITVNLDSTAVSAASYGSASSVGTFTVDAQGRLTAAANSAIAITASQVTDLTKSSVGLGNVDNTSDLNKPVSTAQQTALDLKANLASPTFTGTVTLPDNTVALGTKTTGDYVSSLVAGTGVTLTNNSGETSTPTIAIGQAVGTGASVTFAEITTTGNVVVGGNLTVQGSVTTVNTEQLNIEDNIITLNSGVTGAPTLDGGVEINRGTSTDVAILWNETSDKWTFTNDGTTYANLGDVTAAAVIAAAGGDGTSGQALTTNGSGVLDFTTIVGTTEASIISAVGADGAAGAVLSTNGAGNLTFVTSVPVANGGTGATTDSGARTNLGLGNVDNTSDANKPVSTAQQTALNLKANLAGPTFTGTVSGITATMVGLGNADNTSDANKPVSTAQQTALDLKANLASPTFTGTVTVPTPTSNAHAATKLYVDDAVTAATASNTVELGADTTGDYVATITGGTGVTSTAATTGEGTTHTLSIGQAVGTGSNVTFNNLTVSGDLTVSGTTTTVNTTEILLEDNIITLNSGATGAATTTNAGIEIERGSDTNVVLRWNETTDTWQTTNDGTNYYNIVTTSTAAAQVTAAAVIAAAGGDGTSGQAITTNGSGTLDFTTIVGTTEASIISAVGADGANGAVLMTNGSGDLTFTTLTAAKISDFSEAAQDAVESAITAGTGITKAYNDGANTISLSIGQDVATSAAVTFGSIATGAITLDSGTGELNTSTQAVTINTITTVDSFDKTVYRTAKYLVQVTQGSKYTTSEVLLAHDGTTSYLSEYAVIELGGTVIPLTVSTSISASNVLLRVTITDAATTSATVKVARTLIAV